jgi:hypothetical protein
VGRRLRRCGTIAALCVAIAAAGAFAAAAAVTRSRAAAVAGATLLRHSDLPGFTQGANPITAQERQENTAENRCDGGVPDSAAWSLAQSPGFQQAKASSGQSVAVSSEAAVMPSTALVARALAAITGPRGVGCLASSLRSELRASLPTGQTLRSIATARLPSVVTGADTAFRDRFTVIIAVKQGKSSVNVPLFADAIGFSYGQVGVSLTVQTVLETPSTALEHTLAGVLLARARAAVG